MQTLAHILEKIFKLKSKNTNIKTELLAGITTFVAVSYIIFVNPSILVKAGIPQEAAIAATIYSTALITALMGFWANFPVAVAPGMGINAFFAFYICGVLKMPWQVGLGAVFISGIVFIILTVTKVRQLIIDAVPLNLKTAIVVGIGVFIAFIGLKNSGIVISNDATFVGLGNLTQKEPLLACSGLLITAMLMARQIKGAILYGILVTTLLAMVFNASPTPHNLESIFSFNLPSPSATFLQLDIMGALSFGLFSILLTLTIVDLFDNMGTLIGLSRKANLMDKNGQIPNLDKALMTDAVGTVCSSLLGTSTVTSYIESAAGIAEGGKTGLTAITVAFLFLLSLFFAPLIGLVPTFATAPALIIVGTLMMMEVNHIDFTDFTNAFPAFMTIIMMPLTFSIASGFGFGFISFTLIKVLAGRRNEVKPLMWIISLAFIANFALRSH